MKKKVLLIAVTSLSLALGVTAGIIFAKKDNIVFSKATDGSYWNHYAQVTPTWDKHGSKEFWANCSTHNFTLVNPGAGEDIREGVAFDTTPYFDELTSEDPRYLPPSSERVDIKGYLNSLLDAFNHDPYSYIPNTMRPEGVTKVSESEVTYDFENFTDVSEIKYGGFGEQWHMVIENIKESQRFYNITTYGSEVLTAANLITRAFLDNYYDNVVTKTFNEASFTAKIDFHSNVLTYNIQYISGINVPLFGEIIPQIDMEYVIATNTKTVRIQLGENNALKFVIRPDSYTFGLEYGIEAVSRKAYFTISEDEYTGVEGHIYEYVQFKDKDLVPACADFYIKNNYTSVVGNKASGMPGFDGFINELYETDDGKLIGYKVKETYTKTFMGHDISATYHTLWFNLDCISGIDNVKAISNGGVDPHENNHDIYLNDSESIFTPTKNEQKILFVTIKTSRKYDVEMRTQFFYGVESEQVVEYERDIPMMFIQDDHDEYTNYTDFEHDIQTDCGIPASVNLSSTYLAKIRNDYNALIPIFEVNKDNMPSASIVDFIGDAEII